MKERKENQNPKARIAFMVWSPFHYYIYKNIVKYLPEAEFILCPPWYKWGKEREADLNEMAAFFKEKETRWQVLTEIDDQVIVEKFFEPYQVICSVFLQPPLDTLALDSWFLKKKSILIAYGAWGKDLATVAPWTAWFDYSLAEGPATAEFHKLLTDTYIVGFPKYDDWFSNTFDFKKIEEIKNKLNPHKKTVLYLPTHSGLSSLPAYGEAVRNLLKNYNVLVKFHNHNTLAEKNEVERFRQESRVLLFGANDDLLPLLFLADVVVSDYSSVLFETILVDKPLVIPNIFDSSVIQKHITNEEFNGFWYSGGLTSQQSIEEALQPDTAPGVIVHDSDKLQQGLEEALTLTENFLERRKKLREKVFIQEDGKSGERAARAIQIILGQQKPIPPLLGMSFRSYLEGFYKNYQFRIEQKKIRIYELRKRLSSFEKIQKERNLFRKIRFIIEQFL